MLIGVLLVMDDVYAIFLKIRKNWELIRRQEKREEKNERTNL